MSQGGGALESARGRGDWKATVMCITSAFCSLSLWGVGGVPNISSSDDCGTGPLHS